jgi:hypothetical protein
MLTELDGVRAGDNAPILISSPSQTKSWPSGLHNQSQPEEKIYSDPESPVHGTGGARQWSIPSTHRHGSVCYQSDGSLTCGLHSSDLLPDDRRQSLPIRVTTQESIPFDSGVRISNIEISGNSGRHDSNTMGPATELAVEPFSPSVSSVSLKLSRWFGRRRSRITEPGLEHERKGKYFLIIYILLVVISGLLIGFIVVLHFYFKFKGKVVDLALPTSKILQQPGSMPITDSSIGAADVVIGTYFSTAASGVLQTKLVYNDGKGSLCVRTKSGNDWLNVQCLEGANPRADTPLTVLDWLGGPSIYFITADNFLSGMDHMPLNDTWKFSTLRDQKRPTHKQSQLASVTWFNGTSSWLYYQDANEQLREYGLDD